MSPNYTVIVIILPLVLFVAYYYLHADMKNMLRTIIIMCFNVPAC